MLEAYLAKLLGKSAQVVSAGLEGTGIDPQAVRLMAEDGFVIAGQNSKGLEEVNAYTFNTVLYCSEKLMLETNLEKESCQIICANFSEIKGFGGSERLERMRELRNEIKGYANELANRIKNN
jgi:protein-tyrosine-phosphatase